MIPTGPMLRCCCRAGRAATRQASLLSEAVTLRVAHGPSQSDRAFQSASARLAQAGSASSIKAREAGASHAQESATKQAERSMRRFWKEVSVAKVKGKAPQQGKDADGQEHLTVQLDARSLKTPAGQSLHLPLDRPLLASLIAQEWDEQDRVLRPHALPLTSLVARALDGMSTKEQRDAITADLLRYFDTDTICFHETQPPVLVELQKAHWNPLLAWVRERFSVEVRLHDGVSISGGQDSKARETLLAHVRTLEPLQLAAFERAVMTTKSFLIALAIVEGRLDVEQASRAAEVEVRSQIERWGEVEDTHDVDHHDVRRMLGSVAIALVKDADSATLQACL